MRRSSLTQSATLTACRCAAGRPGFVSRSFHSALAFGSCAALGALARWPRASLCVAGCVAGCADARRQEFLRTTEAAFRTHALWRNATEEELEASGEGLEKYLMTKIYARTFAVVPDDVERDRVRPRALRAQQQRP